MRLVKDWSRSLAALWYLSLEILKTQLDVVLC